VKRKVRTKQRCNGGELGDSQSTASGQSNRKVAASEISSENEITVLFCCLVIEQKPEKVFEKERRKMRRGGKVTQGEEGEGGVDRGNLKNDT